MHRIIIPMLVILASSIVPSIAPAQYVFGFGSAGQESGRMVFVDETNEAVVGASFQNTINPDPNGSTPITSSGDADVALLRYNMLGQLVWAKRFGGATTTDIPTGGGADNARNIFVVGYFGSTADNLPHAADFNPAGGGTVTTKSGYDGFIAKYTENGDFIWALGLGSTTSNSDERCWDVAVDTAGNCYVTGAFHGTVDFNPRGATPVFRTTSKTEAGIFLAKYNGAGILQWVVAVDAGLASVEDEGYTAVDYDQQKGVFWAGNFRGANVNFNPSASTLLSSTGATDMFLANYNGLGLLAWVEGFGSPAADLVSPGGMRIDHDDNPCLTGRIGGPVDFDPSGGVAMVSNAGMFVASYGPKGAYRSAFGLPSNPGCSSTRVAFDAVNNLYICGWMNGVVNFDPVGVYNVTATSTTADAFLARYSATFTLDWVDHFGAANSAGNNACHGLAIDKVDFPCITGQFYGTNLDFDPAPSVTKFLSSAGQGDCFVGRYTETGTQGTPVPVELAGFSAGIVPGGVELLWRTASETSNHGFEIRRAKGGEDVWTVLAFVPGQGTSTREHAYRHLDASASAVADPVLRYRIVQIDEDGARTPSPIVEVVRDMPEDFAVTAVFPEPASVAQYVGFTLRVPALVSVTVYDMRGIARFEDARACSAGTHVTRINTAGLRPGVYRARIRATTDAGVVREHIRAIHVMR